MSDNKSIVINYWIEKAQADYSPMVSFDIDQVKEIVEQSAKFTTYMAELIK